MAGDDDFGKGETGGVTFDLHRQPPANKKSKVEPDKKSTHQSESDKSGKQRHEILGSFFESEPQNIARKLITERFVHDDRRTLCVYQNVFFIFEDGHWTQIADEFIDTLVTRFLDRHITLLRLGKDDPTEVGAQRRHTVEVMHALRSQTRMGPKLIAPCWIADSPPPWGDAQVLVMRNGILDPITGVLYASDPRWFTSERISVEFNPDARCPLFMTTLQQWFPNDQQSIENLQEITGYAASGDNDQEKIIMLVGKPRSGRGTYLSTLGAMFQGSITYPLLSSFCKEFGAESLIGRSLAVFTDARLSKRDDTAAGLEKMLSISGRDSPAISRKNQVVFEGGIKTRLMFACNELPALPDASGAFGTRIFLILFEESFVGREDIHLKSKLATELPGIFNWALAGLQRLRERGHFVMTAGAAEEVADYIFLNNPLGDFLNDCVELDPDGKCDKDQLYALYRSWAERERLRSPYGKSGFYRLLKPVPGIKTICRCDPVTGKTRDPTGERPSRHVHGLRSKPAEPDRPLHCPTCGVANDKQSTTCRHCQATLDGVEP